jgi:multisubunit Na+/H+ antiporter MnhC subunit
MLLSDQNGYQLTSYQFTPAGVSLLALTLWISGVYVVRRRGWVAKVIGSVLLLGAVWLSALLVNLLLLYKAAREEGGPPLPNLAPTTIPSQE